eukprot:TRINITY_DN3512_c1_g5_i1.p1 TRINITY_DN3512_c1_g5~~TRINITY_DN3512_c1_g5_i1.p1  ORF type:complete len:270 (+),score=52.76 TRINITY_DN3512_c1_g5_i1:1414-2223(+)
MSSPQNSDALDDMARVYDTFPMAHDFSENISAVIKGKSWYVELEGKSGTSMLDFGCGTGLNSFACQSGFDSILGVDISETMIEVVNEKIAASGVQHIQAEVVGEDPQSVLEGKSFDMALMAIMLHHVDNPGFIIDRVSSVMKQDGRVVIAEFNPGYLQEKIPMLSDEIHSVFQQNGFTLESLDVFSVDNTWDESIRTRGHNHKSHGNGNHHHQEGSHAHGHGHHSQDNHHHQEGNQSQDDHHHHSHGHGHHFEGIEKIKTGVFVFKRVP